MAYGRPQRTSTSPARNRARVADTRRRADALTSLSAVAALLNDRPDNGDAAMDRLLMDATNIVGFPVVLLEIADAARAVNTFVKCVGLPHLVGQVSPFETCAETDPGNGGKVIVRESIAPNEVETAADHALQNAGVRALVRRRLLCDGDRIGTLTFGDFKPRSISSLDVELATLWSSQTCLLLSTARLHEQLAGVRSEGIASSDENARLHAQALRDGEIKATLLRELHHRVKNNLAAIVGLLSTNVPEMPPAAQRWLDRLTERIGSMARAQELFDRSTAEVRLSEVVRRVMESIAAVTPRGVKLSHDVIEMNSPLPADRAVALTMVLHELCHNALTYGVGENGAITLRAGPAGAGRVRIEVIDDGSAKTRNDRASQMPGADEISQPQESGASAMGIGRAKLDATLGCKGGGKGGVGIHVVRGLVARELRGEFSLLCPKRGGTTAAIEFPIEDVPREVTT